MGIKKKKRGMIEVQFNWILIMVIGVLVILFFVRVAYTQKVMADRNLAIKLLNQFSLITSGAEAATSTASEIPELQNIKFSFTCFEGDCKYRVSELGESDTKSYNRRAMFAPSIIQGRSVVLWAVDWNMPYKVTNFLYITSPDIRYVFVHALGNPPDYFFNIVKKLPDQINDGKAMDDFYDILQIDDASNGFEYHNEYMVRIIAYDPEGNRINPDDFSRIINDVDRLGRLNYKMITILIIKPAGGETNYGTLEFYKLNRQGHIIRDNQDDTFYIGDASLLGAILVDNYDNYAYPMESAYKRLNYVSEVYEKRAEDLNAYFASHQDKDPGGKCRGTYNEAINKIRAIKSYTVKDFTSIDSDSISLVNEAAFGTRGLQILNDNNALQFSCPLIY